MEDMVTGRREALDKRRREGLQTCGQYRKSRTRIFVKAVLDDYKQWRWLVLGHR